MNIRDLINSEPEVGDIVEMELGDVLVETVIDEVLDDGVVIRVDENLIKHMIAYNKQLMESDAQQAAIAIHKREEVAENTGNTVDSIIRANPNPVKSLVAGKGISSMHIRALFNEFLNVKAVSYDDMYDDKGEVVARIIRDWLSKNDVSELDEAHDPWKDKHFGPTKAIKKIFRVKTDDKSYKVRAETEQEAKDVIEKHAPGANIRSVEFVSNIMHEQGVAEDEDPCWKNYKQVGMKDKGGKQVPNCVPKESVEDHLDEKGPGLWANIHAKRKRIKAGSGERMRKPGSKGAPTDDDIKSIQASEKNESSNYGDLDEAKYQGREVTLNQPMAGDVAKSKVYVKNAKGNVVKVNFGQKGVKIKKSNPKRRKSFRARHGCDNPGPKWKAKYWSCRAW